MEVTGHVHALVAVTPVTTEQEAGWVSAGNWTPDSLFHSLANEQTMPFWILII
jgi:hypothetical protein